MLVGRVLRDVFKNVFKQAPIGSDKLINSSLHEKVNDSKSTTTPRICSNYLGEFHDIIGSDKKLRYIAATLYGVDEKGVSVKKKEGNRAYVKKITISIAGDGERTFFLKKTWGSGAEEAVGLHLHNLVSDTPIAYTLFSGEILAIDEVKGRQFYYIGEKELDDPEVAFNYGVAEAVAEFLGLSDRHDGNVFLDKEKRVRHIDFGWAFHEYNCELGLGSKKPKDEKMREEGRKRGREIIKERCMSNMDEIKELFKTVDKMGLKIPVKEQISKYLESSAE